MIGEPLGSDGENNNLPGLIGAIGQQALDSRLLGFLYRACGAEHAAVFHLTAKSLSEVAAASIDGSDTARQQAGRYLHGEIWHSDPTIGEARAALLQDDFALLRTDIAGLSDRRLRDEVYGKTGIEDRVLICGHTDSGMVGLSILRSHRTGPFSDRELAEITKTGRSLLAVLAKHIELSCTAADVSVALTSLREIEACIAAAPEAFPRREAEVCSRIIYGVSTVGIALELEISEQTVMTYRQRGYHRIGIATQRELILWYLRSWSRWVRTRGGMLPGGTEHHHAFL